MPFVPDLFDGHGNMTSQMLRSITLCVEENGSLAVQDLKHGGKDVERC